jgi:predicted nucleic acid-binding protein
VNTRSESWDYEAVIDVGIVVPACFDNPLREASVRFLGEVLTGKRRAALPVTAIVGAYHIATSYLRVPRLQAKKILQELLRTQSPALYPHVTPELAADALDYAAAYEFESWDGYLIAVARAVQTSIVYSLDEGLRKAREITVANPFPSEKIPEYHAFLEARRPKHE